VLACCVHTVRAYRDALKLFYLFLASHKRKPLADLALEDIQSDAVLAFLDHVESQRGNSAVTRNCRLAAVRSFVEHLLRQDVTRAGQYGRILASVNPRSDSEFKRLMCFYPHPLSYTCGVAGCLPALAVPEWRSDRFPCR
jgi:site-specific recombinase XerD